jgi:uncharacterized cupin superfamily protein
MPVQLLNSITSEPDQYYVAPEKLISGNPLQTLWMEYIDPSNKFFVGTWHSGVGTWKVSYTEFEECQILEGVSVITEQDGVAVTLRAGDRFVIPRGFIGTWQVVEPTKKTFVVYEPGESELS